MQHTKKLTITLFGLTFLIHTISVDAAAGSVASDDAS